MRVAGTDTLLRLSEYLKMLAFNDPVLIGLRTLSYVSLVLTNLYFMSHNTKWIIGHAENAIFV